MGTAAILNLLLQSRHSLLQVQLQTLVGLGEESVHRVRQTLVVLFVHLFPLTGLQPQNTRLHSQICKSDLRQTQITASCKISKSSLLCFLLRIPPKLQPTSEAAATTDLCSFYRKPNRKACKCVAASPAPPDLTAP